MSKESLAKRTGSPEPAASSILQRQAEQPITESLPGAAPRPASASGRARFPAAIEASDKNAAGPLQPNAQRIQRILVPIDFSPCSTKALRYAVPLAGYFGARLFLLYVGQSYYPVPGLGPVDEAVEERARAHAKARLTQLAAQEIRDRVPSDILIRNGHPPEEIVRAARACQADLIIISTHGYRGLKHAWFGSFTENVVRHAPCPVLAVRELEHEFVKYEKTKLNL